MENNELYSFGDMPMSELMHALTSPIDVDSEEDSGEDFEHSGIKGMKWGVRRYQNKDGSLTAAGKKRYNQELSKVRAAEKVVKTKQATKAKIDKLNDRKKAVEDAEAELEKVPARTKSSPKKSASTDVETTPKKRTAKDMSDDELNSAIKRMQLEKQFNTLQSELNPKKESMGKDFVKKLAKNALDGTAEAAKSATRTFMEKKLKEVLGVDDKTAEKAKSAYEKIKEEVEMLDMKKRLNDHKKDNTLKSKADETNLKKQTLENEKRIKQLTEELSAKPDKTAERLAELKREKQEHENKQQIKALEEQKKNNWKDPKKNQNK